MFQCKQLLKRQRKGKQKDLAGLSPVLAFYYLVFREYYVVFVAWVKVNTRRPQQQGRFMYVRTAAIVFSFGENYW